MRLTFLGASGTVTGSKYLLETGSRRLLVDCGLFQGPKALRERNWEPLPVKAGEIEAVLLTHAHLDHSGYLPLLVKEGFRKPIFCTSATADLAEILLVDSGHLQEKDAEFANRHGYSKHRPALPLYTEDDARKALRFLRPVAFDAPHAIDAGVTADMTATWRHAGHILGAASVEVQAGGTSILFSGDIGRFGDPILPDPALVRSADFVVVESTYGNRSHDKTDPAEALAEVVTRTVGRGGTVVIPAFAVGRAQSLMYHLERLTAAGRLRHVPVFLDSPMAIDASELFCRHPDDHRLSPAECHRAFASATYVRTVDESKALTANPVPKVIISASGMATGGRVLHHLKRFAPEARNTILFAGFQAAGTRGEAMMAGAREVKIHGEDVPVRAEVANLSMLSAHADADEIIRWLRGFERAPRKVFVTHGEPEAAAAMAKRIGDELGWATHIPRHLEAVTIEAATATP